MKAVTIFLITLLFSLSATAAEPEIYELRTYHAAEGKLDELHARFRDHTVELFTKHGMTNVAYWVPMKNEESNTLVYLMAYPNREKRDAMWKAFMADPIWKAAYAESTKDGKLVAKVDSLFLVPTDYSPKLKIESQNPPRLFEMREYTTNEGKLDDINKRFRDHTVKLFERHNLTNVLYFNYAEGQPGAENTLLYFLAHKDEASVGENFKAFSQDPEWKKARAESEKDGKILIPKGVKSTLLVPTDYSPTK